LKSRGGGIGRHVGLKTFLLPLPHLQKRHFFNSCLQIVGVVATLNVLLGVSNFDSPKTETAHFLNLRSNLELKKRSTMIDYKIYPFKRKKVIRLYVMFYDEYGQRRQFSTGITLPLGSGKRAIERARKEAVAPAEQKVRAFLRGEAEQKRPKFMRLSHYLHDEYYPFLKANRSRGTYVSYHNALTHFLRICGDKALLAYHLKHINTYKNTRFNKEGIKKTTINIELRAIKAAFSWAWKYDFLEKHPFKGQAFLFDAKAKRPAFSKAQINRLIQVTQGTMVGLAIQLSYYTGMRIGELTSIRWKMVNLEGKFINIPADLTKSSKSRHIPLSSKAFNIVQILHAQLRARMKKHPAWYSDTCFEECFLIQKEKGWGKYHARSIQDRFRDLMNETGLPKELTFHSLRHTFATHILENGGDIYAVSKILGHSTPNITSEFYDHTTGLNYRNEVNLL
jgi:site-specific recombinase XerD